MADDQIAELETDIGVDLDDGFYSTTSSGVVQTPRPNDFYQLTFPVDLDDLDDYDDGIQDINNDGSSEASSSSAAGLHARVFCDNMVQINNSDSFLPSNPPAVSTPLSRLPPTTNPATDAAGKQSPGIVSRLFSGARWLLLPLSLPVLYLGFLWLWIRTDCLWRFSLPGSIVL